MKKIVILLLLIFTFSLLVANPLAKIYQHDDPLLVTLNNLSRVAGIIPVSSAGPLTGYEVAQHIEILKTKTLPPYAQQQLKELDDTVQNTLSDIPFGMRIRITPEIYGNTDKHAEEKDWIARYNNRQSFAYGEVDTILGDNIYGIFSYGIKRKLIDDEFSKVVSNFPFVNNFGETQLQNSYPQTVFMGISNNTSSVVFGRDTLGWGQGNTGNLLIGNHVPYHDFLKATTSNKYLQYTFLAIPMDEISQQGQVKPSTTGSSDLGLFAAYFHNSLARTFIAHRLEILLPKVRISLTEGVLFYVDRVDMRMFNPLMFLHNYQNFGEVNNSMSVEIEVALLKGLSLNVQLFLDQIQTKGEVGAEGDNIPPNAFATLLGLNFTSFTKKGVLNAYLEGVYTSPYAYLRTGDETGNYYTHVNEGGDIVYEQIPEDKQFNLDFVHAIAMRGGKGGISFLGYKFGPDTIAAGSGVSFEDKRGFSLSSDLLFIIQGENGLHIDDKKQKVEFGLSELNRLSPTGNPTFRFIITATGEYSPSFVKGLSIIGRTDLVNTWHKYEYSFDAQFNVGIVYSVTLF